MSAAVQTETRTYLGFNVTLAGQQKGTHRLRCSRCVAIQYMLQRWMHSLASYTAIPTLSSWLKLVNIMTREESHRSCNLSSSIKTEGLRGQVPCLLDHGITRRVQIRPTSIAKQIAPLLPPSTKGLANGRFIRPGPMYMARATRLDNAAIRYAQVLCKPNPESFKNFGSHEEVRS